MHNKVRETSLKKAICIIVRRPIQTLTKSILFVLHDKVALLTRRDVLIGQQEIIAKEF